ncbi:uncharacterized protein N7446_003997 [Penicillium canescens]|uniref:Uncharacterized protein n=1 Tax=Penicillium canescens TaxID=5083 RepID=A0AAD6I354_PENCN|nr:uncharacterized protein N7446_003997 [Penicillium canescens]KAJ6027409.1 hypothetical protein N7460_012226 [Penicillium canescens]KAJ6040688.1 hypothetical protein N7444_009593 [Penicillium canescens]KAJ6066960.1 hypothetical protein N7446_003997 [Penicillium canescens]
MSVQVTYDADCDQNFRRLYHNQFQQWVNANHRFTIHDGTIVDFDQAHVLNGLHPTKSTHDPNPAPHVTVRLSTPSLRSQRMWYILHWRVSDGSVLLPQPDNEESNRRRQMRRREKKQRRQERDRNIRESREGISAEGRSSGAGDSSRGPVPPRGTGPPRGNDPTRGGGHT